MKNCIQCGAEAADEATVCAQCGHKFSYVGQSGPPVAATPAASPDVRTRPDGSALILVGQVGFCLAGLLFLVALFQGSGGGLYDSYAGAAGRRWLFMVFAGGFLQLGLLLFLVGSVIRAIWFLDGVERKAAPQARAPQPPVATPPGKE